MVEIEAPLYVYLEITNKCNLDCKYCYSWPNCTASVLPKEKVLNLVRALSDLGVFAISIEGGEPFLHPNIIEILEECLNYDLQLSVLSNGVSISDETEQKLQGLDSRLELQVSLDSHIAEINDRARGSGRQVVERIESLTRKGIDVTIATVVHKQNIDVAAEVIDYFYPKVKRYHYMNIMPTCKALMSRDVLFPCEKELDEFWAHLDEKKERFSDIVLSNPKTGTELNKDLGHSSCRGAGCFAGLTRVTITPELNVLACPIDRTSFLGNLDQKSFEEIWHSENAERIRKDPLPFCARNFAVLAHR